MKDHKIWVLLGIGAFTAVAVVVVDAAVPAARKWLERGREE